FVTVSQPLRFFGISQFYARFEQTSDDEVRAWLDAARF
ncbi:phosphoribosyltransferase, partial [Escherichia coli]|nr:phosphoribosyltransferase [Escherichia coli]